MSLYNPQANDLSPKTIRFSNRSTDRSLDEYHYDSDDSIQLTTCFNLSSEYILEFFEIIAKQLNYQFIQKEQNYATIVKQKSQSVLSLFSCFNWFGSNTQSVTVIKINIQHHVKDFRKVCQIKGLSGNEYDISFFLKKFQKVTQEYRCNDTFFFQQEDYQISQQQSNPFYIENCAMYYFHKTLSNTNTKLGKWLNEQLNKLQGNLKPNQEITNQSQYISKIIKLVDKIIRKFQQQQIILNDNLVNYRRISIQKYLFDKIFKNIFKKYIKKNEQSQKIYLQKRQKIISKLTLKQLFQQCSLSQKFQFISNQKKQNKYTLTQLKALLDYTSICQQLEKISLINNPREKIKCCGQMYAKIKTLVYCKSNKKYQLSCMEDIIPTMILLVLLVNVSHLGSQLDFMLDFLKFDPCEMETQKRLILNLSESYKYIIRQWSI